MILTGLHSLILLTGDADRAALFYTTLLGLTPLEDRIEAGRRVLVFTDERQASRDYLLLVEEPGASRGRSGVGAMHHTAFLVESTNGQLKWKRWLTDHDVRVMGPYDRGYFRSIYFRDPDGNLLELATRWPGLDDDEDEEELGTHEIIPAVELTAAGRDEEAIRLQTWPEPLKKISGDMDVTRLHHFSSIVADPGKSEEFYSGVLGFRLVKRTRSYDDTRVPHIYFGIDYGEPGTLATFFGPAPENKSAARPGLGVPLAFGFSTESTPNIENWRRHLRSVGVAEEQGLFPGDPNTIYFRDPDGILLYIASDNPPFAAAGN